MSIDINDTARVVEYSATAAQTVFTIPFEFYENEDIAVTRNGVALSFASSPAGVTEFSVTRNSGTGQGSITLGGGATLDDVILIYSDAPIKRTTNFPLSGIFAIGALNEQLNKLTILIADVARDVARTLRAPLGESGYTLRPNTELDGKLLLVQGSEIIGNAALGAAEGPLTIQAEHTTTTDTLDIDDQFTGKPYNNASAITVTVPPSSSVAFTKGAFIEGYQVGAGAVTLAAGAGVTLRSRNSQLTTAGQHAVFGLRYLGNDVWQVFGDLVA